MATKIHVLLYLPLFYWQISYVDYSKAFDNSQIKAQKTILPFSREASCFLSRSISAFSSLSLDAATSFASWSCLWSDATLSLIFFCWTSIWCLTFIKWYIGMIVLSDKRAAKCWGIIILNVISLHYLSNIVPVVHGICCHFHLELLPLFFQILSKVKTTFYSSEFERL